MKAASSAPHFDASSFTATQFDSAQDKADFANRLVKLIKGDFKPTLFTKKLYHDLALSFGFIAHYDRDGFYAAQMSTLPRRLGFLKSLYHGGKFAGASGDPHFTRSDVEKAFRHNPWIGEQITRLQSDLDKLVVAGEKADLHRLAAKYPEEIASI